MTRVQASHRDDGSIRVAAVSPEDKASLLALADAATESDRGLDWPRANARAWSGASPETAALAAACTPDTIRALLAELADATGRPTAADLALEPIQRAPTDRIVVTFHLPMPMTTVARLLEAVAKVYPRAYARPARGTGNIMDVWVPADDRAADDCVCSFRARAVGVTNPLCEATVHRGGVP